MGKGEPVALDLEEIVSEGGATKARDVVCELAESRTFSFGIGFGVDVAGHGGVLELGPEKEFGNKRSALSVMNARSAMCLSEL